MKDKLSQPWIPIDKIESLVQIEPALFTLGLALGSWVAYKLFLKSVSEERHMNLKGLFRNLFFHATTGVTLFAIYYGMQRLSFLDPWPGYPRITAYVGLMVLLAGATTFIKACRILVFEYFFLSHMRVAVPLLLINLVTLLFALFIGGWIFAEIFNIRVVPFLATSAMVSLVLGLALQDTLGNLFAGVALQFDKPYEIGDWIEISTGPAKWTGQVEEISWRATTLLGLSDETITVPNRTMAQAHISNFSRKNRPFARSQVFRVAHSTPLEQARKALSEAALSAGGVRKYPKPIVLVSEVNEHWLALKVSYFIDDFGSQFSIADRVQTQCLTAMEQEKIQIAASRLQILQ